MSSNTETLEFKYIWCNMQTQRFRNSGSAASELPIRYISQSIGKSQLVEGNGKPPASLSEQPFCLRTTTKDIAFIRIRIRHIRRIYNIRTIIVSVYQVMKIYLTYDSSHLSHNEFNIVNIELQTIYIHCGTLQIYRVGQITAFVLLSFLIAERERHRFG